ncbi:MAG: hypothetical protein K6G38_06125 [Gammaproteobacteria bacterium]|nr:hypothetical protein [Gammaproteobacteria bacterium]
MSKENKELKKLAFAEYQKFSVEEDPNGVEVVGIIYDKRSKLYLFDPKGEKFAVGDIVTVKDWQDVLRKVPVVLPTMKVSKDIIVEPFKAIETIEERASFKVESTEKVKGYVYDKVIFKETSKKTLKLRNINGNNEHITDELNKVCRMHEKTLEPTKDFVKLLDNLGSVEFIDSRTGKKEVKEVRNEKQLAKYLEYIAGNKNIEITIK